MHKLSIVSEQKPLDALYIPTPLVCEPIMHIWLVKEAYEAFYRLSRDMQDSGLSPVLGARGYQCFAYQKKLYQNEVQRLIRLGEKSINAYEKAKTHIAPPGCSEHQLGLSMDFTLYKQEMPNDPLKFEATNQFLWLNKYAKEYGFILRYPKEKEEVTGMLYKPWHYRYVGIGHAKKMEKLNLCLDEYYEAFYSH
ncbi:M15 family metallopeptidase [Niameybacter massiliensis]|uniref:M15 family metallopeptidase n=1 Tax=Niameybacter massiliensis TaxID=1658108 RepID=UPI0006B3FD11|nr:M15 family metallopeptidase [Niameybacter massiliensis]